jgi:hypothetical protein
MYPAASLIVIQASTRRNHPDPKCALLAFANSTFSDEIGF